MNLDRSDSKDKDIRWPKMRIFLWRLDGGFADVENLIILYVSFAPDIICTNGNFSISFGFFYQGIKRHLPGYTRNN